MESQAQSPTTASNPPPKSPIPGPKVLLIGSSGTGKTHSLRTLVDCGITPFVVFTEQGMDILSEIPPEKLHWHYVRPTTTPWDTLTASAKMINQLSFSALKSWQDPNKNKYFSAWEELLKCCNNFVCDRDGKSYGDVSTWGTDRALVFDGLSGISRIALKLVVGGHPSPDQSQWGCAMETIETIIEKLCLDLQCMLVIIAHTEREVSEEEGTSKLMASTLGRKLAPKLPRNFSDVIQTLRVGTEWTWSTVEAGVDTKARNVPWGKGLKPSFAQVIDPWVKRGGIITPNR